MGSLLKEYFIESRNGDEVSSDASTMEKQDVTENATVSSEEKPIQELENSKNGNLDADDTDKTKGSYQTSTEGEVTSKKQFKNIVAIVDPPRGGLHPTVSIYLSIFLVLVYCLLCWENKG